NAVAESLPCTCPAVIEPACQEFWSADDVRDFRLSAANKFSSYVPLSHPFVERLIGTIRRELLDRTLFWTTADLQGNLIDFQTYYNAQRPHAGLEGRLPEPGVGGSASIDLCSCRWQRHCRGLFQTPNCRMILGNSPWTRVW